MSNTPTRSDLGKRLGALCVAVAMTAVVAPAYAGGDAEEFEVPEALFTEKAAVDKEVELEFGYDSKATEDEYEISAAASWVFFDRLELGVAVPFGLREPDVGSSQSNIGDVEFSAKYQFLEAPTDGLNFSLAANVAAPTGDRDKEIGGVGEWGVAALAGTLVDTGENLPNIGIHLQGGFRQQIRLSNEQKEAAADLGVDNVRQKELVWNAALNMPLYHGRFVPSFELLGTTILDAVDPAEEGTIVELGGGVWISPFAEDDEALGPLAVGVAAKGPLTNRRESDFSALVVLKYEFM